jgi:hypothetical protein
MNRHPIASGEVKIDNRGVERTSVSIPVDHGSSPINKGVKRKSHIVYSLGAGTVPYYRCITASLHHCITA